MFAKAPIASGTVLLQERCFAAGDSATDILRRVMARSQADPTGSQRALAGLCRCARVSTRLGGFGPEESLVYEKILANAFDRGLSHPADRAG